MKRSIDGGDFVEILRGPVPVSDNFLNMTAAVEGTIYAFRFAAYFNGQLSGYSEIKTFMVPPAKPTELEISDEQPTGVTLTWQDNSLKETGYEVVALSAWPQEDQVFNALLEPDAESLEVTGLDEGTPYKFMVRAIANSGASEFVSEQGRTELFAPEQFSGSAPNPNEINLTWEDHSSGEAEYHINYWKTDEPESVYPIIAPVNATGFPFLGLEPDTDYTFELMAIVPIQATYENEEDEGGIFRTDALTVQVSTPPGDEAKPPEPPAPEPEPLPGQTVYRWSLTNEGGGTTFSNSGNLNLSGAEQWSTTPLPLGAALAQVHGTIHSDSTGALPPNLPEQMDYTYPGPGFAVEVVSSTEAHIWLEDETGREHNDGDFNDGHWVLELVTDDWGSAPPAPDPEIPPDGYSDVPYVSIVASDPVGSESPDDGESEPGPLEFTVYRAGDTDSNLTVHLFAAAGTAVAADYTGMPASVIIPNGQDHVEFTVTPVDDALAEPFETVLPILKADAAYRLSMAFMAAGAIADNEPDLDVDSDNDNGADLPERDDHEDKIEDSTEEPGKVLKPNDGDLDGDSIPDFADGYNLAGGDTASQTGDNTFVPMVLRLPPGVEPADATLKFEYDESDPVLDILLPNETESGDFEVAEGTLRLWTKASNDARSSSYVMTSGGNFIPSGPTFDATKLDWNSGLTTIWLEAVAVSTSLGDLLIEVEVDADGTGPLTAGTDAVRATALSIGWVDEFVNHSYGLDHQDPDDAEDGDSDNFFVRKNNDHRALDLIYRIHDLGIGVEDVEIKIYAEGNTTPIANLKGLRQGAAFSAGEELGAGWDAAKNTYDVMGTGGFREYGFYRIELDIKFRNVSTRWKTSVADGDTNTDGWQTPRGGLSIHDLVYKHRPEIHLTQGEFSGPVSVKKFMENSILEDSTGNSANLASIFHNMGGTADGENWYMNLNDAKRRAGDGEHVVYHYSDHKANANFVFLQSWMFYPSSDTDLNAFADGESFYHEGDWEMFQFTVRRSDPAEPQLKSHWLEPWAGTASQHYYGQTLKWKAAPGDAAPPSQAQDYIEKNGFRPVIYVARGAHATYFRSGTFITKSDANPNTQHQYQVPGNNTTDVTTPALGPHNYELREIEQDDSLVAYWK
jgi:Fibronectin type III domain